MNERSRFRFNPGILPKLLICFLFLAALPLLVLGYIANRNLSKTGELAVRRAQEMGERNLRSAKAIGKTAIEDSVRSLDAKSTEAIELSTLGLAQDIARFLYERDKDVLMLASLVRDPARYLQFFLVSESDVVAPDPGNDQGGAAKSPELACANPENRTSWRHRPPLGFHKEPRALYREIAFVDLEGKERIKIAGGSVSNDLRDVSRREETYCKAEDYFSRLPNLRRGEIYVSRVVGPYVKGWLQFTPDGVKVPPESAYAGKENLGGARFEGIVRWATPVFDQNDEKIGYVTMALDHTHIMEFTNHMAPTEEGFTDTPDAGSGNYAFLWDDRDRCISHPRHFFICGYDPDTGREVPGWLSEETYGEAMRSGLPLDEFVKGLPSFRNFSQKKKGSKEQMQAGNISLDCRVLDTAPQCQGWHDGTEDGGSGSFLIFWSGLWKLTTYAAVPYYTGDYGKTKRGFGYVTVGANVDEFHKAANITRADIQKTIAKQSEDIARTTAENRGLIEAKSAGNRNAVTFITLVALLAVACASAALALGITKPLRRLTEVAAAMARGDLKQFIEVKSRDEVGQLARSFNEMAAAVAEVDQMKSEFVTIASHELRTPIHAMLLSVSGLLEGYSGKIDEEAREDLQLTREGIERLMRLVQDLLDLSRIEARKIELSLTSASLPEMIDKAVDEVSGLAVARGHVIVKDVRDDLPSIRVDRDRLVQAVINVLSNAIKYTPDGGKIAIDAHMEGASVIVSIADNGYGIPEWAQEDVFNKFFQADRIMSQKVGGSGLGLTITRGIVEEHGGTIWCESPLPEGMFDDLPVDEKRKGTVFVTRIPLRRLSSC